MLLTYDIRIYVYYPWVSGDVLNTLQLERFVNRLGTIPMLCRISDYGDSASPTLVSWCGCVGVGVGVGVGGGSDWGSCDFTLTASHF